MQAEGSNPADLGVLDIEGAEVAETMHVSLPGLGTRKLGLPLIHHSTLTLSNPL